MALAAHGRCDGMSAAGELALSGQPAADTPPWVLLGVLEQRAFR
jgi:hypothetical protein